MGDQFAKFTVSLAQKRQWLEKNLCPFMQPLR
jgi:hypothetical protein